MIYTWVSNKIFISYKYKRIEKLFVKLRLFFEFHFYLFVNKIFYNFSQIFSI